MGCRINRDEEVLEEVSYYLSHLVYVKALLYDLQINIYGPLNGLKHNPNAVEQL